MIKKLISEFVGTMLLVFFGCGTAVAINTYATNSFGAAIPFNLVAISLAFGLILMALIYTIGSVSGCHINPAVSIAMAIDKRMSVLDCIEYIVVQILGGIVGAEILGLIFGSYTNLGANGFGELSALQTITNGTMQVTALVAFTMEAILTFVFVLVVLSATAKENKNAGIPIGLTLTLVHIMGIVFTGTSVNPARSIGPALFTGGTVLDQLWLFILAPVIGAIVAAFFYKYIISNKEITIIKKIEEIIPQVKEEKLVEEKIVKKTTSAKPKAKSTKKKTTTKQTAKTKKTK